MTEKTLGQVLYESEIAACALYVTSKPWSALSESHKREYENAAQAVAAVVREQDKQACESAYIQTPRDSMHAHFFTLGVDECIKRIDAIMSMKP